MCFGAHLCVVFFVLVLGFAVDLDFAIVGGDVIFVDLVFPMLACWVFFLQT